MTDDAKHSSDEEDVEEQVQTSAETAALARKRRLLAMKSKIHGIEMKEEDYHEEAKPTKKSKTDEKSFRSYQPISEVLGSVEGGFKDLDVVEKEIESHLMDTTEVKPVETVDISTLAPKKVDWDLKRDIEKRMKKLEHRTQKAIAEIIRKRLAAGEGDLASTVNTAAAALTE